MPKAKQTTSARSAKTGEYVSAETAKRRPATTVVEKRKAVRRLVKQDRAIAAAEMMDWQQVVLNGGPPCFHLDPADDLFCGRARRWHGHGAIHNFVSLADLLRKF